MKVSDEILESSAKQIRLNILRLANQSNKNGNGAHIAPSLSEAEILTALFFFMRPQDLFVLSKGHGGLGYYAALKEANIISEDRLNTFEINGGDFPGQPSKNAENSIIFSSGSLGMGLSYACGLALAAKKQGADTKIYVLLGDGELNEGSNWEAAMFAAHQKLDNLVAVVDLNGMQSDGFSKDILSADLNSLWNACGWKTLNCNGHSLNELTDAFNSLAVGYPNVVLANTVKGKGVSGMENNGAGHHNRLGDQQYEEAVKEVERWNINLPK
jgi:transketolase